MPNVLVTSYQRRNDPKPEFVGYGYLSKYLDVPTDKLKSSGMFDGIPFRYNENGIKEFRLTAALDAIERYKVTPPDDRHPLHEFSQAEAMLELKMDPKAYQHAVKLGRIRLHPGADGRMKVYRRDIEWFIRNFIPRALVANMTEPLVRRRVAMMLGNKLSYFRHKLEKYKIPRAPRKRGDRIKFAKADILNYLDHMPGRHFRKEEMPDMIPVEIGMLYGGFSRTRMKNLSTMNRLKAQLTVMDDGCRAWCVSKSAIDRILDTDAMVDYYCDGLSYYTRKAIRYKFRKTDRWIDEFIAGKCRRVSPKGKVIGREEDAYGVMARGWLQEDVEQVVASGVQCKIIPKKRKAHREERKAMSAVAMSTPPVAFSTPVEQMEAAINAAIYKKEEAAKQKRRELYERFNAETARLNAIRNILTSGPEKRTAKPRRADILRLSDERQVVTILVCDSMCGGRYIQYPNAKSECIFKARAVRRIGRRKIPPSFATAICTALKKVEYSRPKQLPSWIILSQAVASITDPSFHRILDAVPPEVGAVAPFGYDSLLPDGSWSGNPSSYGFYGLHSEISGDRRFVRGNYQTDEFRRLAVMDGPFVAVRGEYMEDLKMLAYFRRLGDLRGAIGPVVSAICRKYGIPMMCIPVDSWGPIEYTVTPGTPEMNLLVEMTDRFVSTPDSELLVSLTRK